jgi:hypothetical protein
MSLVSDDDAGRPTIPGREWKPAPSAPQGAPVSGPIPLDLIKTSELFLVPSSFLVAALGTADTNLHRAAVSIVGLVVSVLWLICSQEARGELIAQHPAASRSARFHILSWLAVLFIAAWLASTVWHLALINKPLGTNF